MSDVDMESRVAEALRARADRARAMDDLHAAALARAGVLRRRRVLGAAGAGLAAAAVVAAVFLAVPWQGGGGEEAPPVVVQPPAESTEVVVPPDPATLPELADAPGAGEQPAAVGTDPAVLHFDVDLTGLDLAAYGLEVTEWSSGPGYEGVRIATLDGSPPMVEIYIGSDPEALAAGAPPPGPYLLTDGTTLPLSEEGEPAPTTIDGRPGTLQEVVAAEPDESVLSELEPRLREAAIEIYQQARDEQGWVLRWQPVDGLHAVVQVRDADQALGYAAAEALQLDRAQRCAVPLRLTALPDGAEWTECRSALHHRPAADGGVAWLRSSITLTRPDGDPVEVQAEELYQAGPADPPVEPNRTVAGYPARWEAGDLVVPEFFGAASLFVSGATEREATRLVEHLDMAFTLDRLNTWPERAIG